MNLHQFRFVQEAARRNLNLTETAKALYTSQPGISKAIIELEEELGVEIFVRHGKRLRRITEPGQLVLKAVEVIMREVANLKRIKEDVREVDTGYECGITLEDFDAFLTGDVLEFFHRERQT